MTAHPSPWLPQLALIGLALALLAGCPSPFVAAGGPSPAATTRAAATGTPPPSEATPSPSPTAVASGGAVQPIIVF